VKVWGLEIKSPKSSKSHKRLSHSTEGKSDFLLSARSLGSGNQVEYEEDFDRGNPSAKVQMSHLVQEPSGGYSRRDSNSNKSDVDEDSRMV